MGAQKGLGTTITFGTSLWSAQVADVSGVALSRGSYRTDHMGTTGGIPYEPEGLVEGGEVTYDVFHDPSTAAVAPPINEANETITINYGGLRATTFPGHMAGYAVSAPKEGPMLGSVTIKVAGTVTNL